MTDGPLLNSSTPIFSIGLAIVVVLLVPIILYSVGPEGPLKNGDVVFVKDRYRVHFVDPTIPKTQGFQDFCILESRVQLVVQEIEDMPGNVLVAAPIGVEKIEVPYCPPRTTVLIKPNQITLKADIWGGLRDTILDLTSRR